MTKIAHPWTNGQVERPPLGDRKRSPVGQWNRTIKETTVKRYYYDNHDQLRSHLSDFIDAYNYTRRLKTLKGRVKRFAKVAGEMVSLGAVEGYASAVWPEHTHAVVSVPCPRKGEQLILITDKQDARRDDLLAYAKE